MDRNYSIDFIKFFAIFSVVLIHSFPTENNYGLIVNILSRFAVPFFFSTAGYLLGKRIFLVDNPVKYFIKYSTKIFKIYLAWLLIYISFDLVLICVTRENIRGGIVNYLENFSIISIIYYGGSTSGYHLWFLPALFFSILVLFIFYRLNGVNVLLVGSLLLNLIGFIGQMNTSLISIPVPTRDALFFGLFYLTLGFSFAKKNLLIDIKQLKLLRVSLILFLLFSFLQVLEHYIIKGPVGTNYYISTIPATWFLMYLVINSPKLGENNLVTKIGANSLGIYVTHVMILKIFNSLLYYFNLEHLSRSVFWNVFYSSSLLIISYIFYNMIQYLKNLLKQTFNVNEIKIQDEAQKCLSEKQSAKKVMEN